MPMKVEEEIGKDEAAVLAIVEGIKY